MALKQWTIMALAFIVVGVTIGLLTGRAIWRIEIKPSDREARLIADSVRTAVIIDERDTIIARYERDIEELNKRISKRKPTNARVNDADKHLHSASADSLMRILDRPLSDR